MLNQDQLGSVDLNLLVVFQVVLEERHVARAARRLAVTPSAVSHGLSRLRALFEDPLFLRTPKGVVPTDRATELAVPVADILSRVRSVLSNGTAFDPKTSTRRFTIGAPDAITVVLLPSLLSDLRSSAPGIDVRVRHHSPEHALTELEARVVDLAITPLDDIPARFAARCIGEEQFVVAARKGHAFLRTPTLDHYCSLKHILVSMSGEATGFVDSALAGRGRARRVAMVAPHFMLALSTLAQTDLVAAIPTSLMASEGARFGLASAKMPLPLARFRLNAVVPRVALMDAGMVWLLERVAHAARSVQGFGPVRRVARA